MDRAIKFRAWDAELNTMFKKVGLDEDSFPYTFDPLSESAVFFPDAKVMQYTGLKDKNGTEIFEGDVVQSDFGEKNVVKYGLQEVDAFEGYGWNLWSFMEGAHADGTRLQQTYEVIGNICENPELLNKEIK